VCLSFISSNTLLKNIKSFAHQRNWLGVQTPELSVGVKKVKDPMIMLIVPLATAS